MPAAGTVFAPATAAWIEHRTMADNVASVRTIRRVIVSFRIRPENILDAISACSATADRKEALTCGSLEQKLIAPECPAQDKGVAGIKVPQISNSAISTNGPQR